MKILNQNGIILHVLPIVVMLLIATIGVYVFARGHAAPLPPNTTSNMTADAAATTAPLVVIMEENTELSDVVSNGNMPFQNALWNGTTGTPRIKYTQFFALRHASIPDYLAFASGFTQWQSTDPVAAGEYAGPTIWNQMSNSGKSWKVFQEGMPSACYSISSYNDPITDGTYTLWHNPATTFNTIYGKSICTNNVLPLNKLNTGSLPAVSFIAPNECNDFHGSTNTMFTNCTVGTASIQRRGDTWLKTEVTKLVNAGARVMVTYDEGSTNWGLDPSGNPVLGDGGGHIYAVLTGKSVSSKSVSTTATVYSILKGIESQYGFTKLGGAAAAHSIPLN